MRRWRPGQDIIPIPGGVVVIASCHVRADYYRDSVFLSAR